jgi:hypothetical protein
MPFKFGGMRDTFTHSLSYFYYKKKKKKKKHVHVVLKILVDLKICDLISSMSLKF